MDNMKNLIIIITILLLASCVTTGKIYHSDMKIIKFQRFGAIKYDWYSSLSVNGNYCVYIKDAINAEKTNYIHGDFELISYEEYQKEELNNGN